MDFRAIRGCKRPEWCQEIVFHVVRHLNWMPKETVEEAYRLISEITSNAREGRALFELLTRDGDTVESVCQRLQVPRDRLYRMRREFYNRFLDEKIRKR